MLQSILGLDAELEAIKLHSTGIVTNHKLCDKEPERTVIGRPRKYTYEPKDINELYESGSDLHSMELSLGMPQAYIGTIIDRYRLRHKLPPREGFEKIVLSDKAADQWNDPCGTSMEVQLRVINSQLSVVTSQAQEN